MTDQLENITTQDEVNATYRQPAYAENMLLPHGYFRVYGQYLSTTTGPKEAWWETEKEFNRRYCSPCEPFVFRRFTNYESFTAAYRKYNSTGMPGHIEIIILEI